MGKHILICEDNNENILSGIYKAFEYCKQNISPDDLDIVICHHEEYETEFFATYETIITDFDKALKTMEYIKKKLGNAIYADVLRAICHFDSNRGYVLFRFLYYCFKKGRSASYDLTNKYVIRTMELARKTGNEAHYFLGFLRFNSIGDILYAKLEPKCNVLPLIIEHFSDRFYIENWIIEDVTHKLFAVHKAHGETRIFSGDFDLSYAGITELSINDEYEALWKTFFDSIGIKERSNPKCQQNLLPLWMRTHITEFR